MQGRTTRPMSLQLNERRVLGYELREVNWSQIIMSFTDHMWWSWKCATQISCCETLLYWPPQLLPLFIHHYVCMEAMLSANDCSSRVLVESILMRCEAPLMENYISRTPHQLDQNFLRTVLKSETTDSPFHFSLYRYQAFHANFFTGILLPKSLVSASQRTGMNMPQ